MKYLKHLLLITVCSNFYTHTKVFLEAPIPPFKISSQLEIPAPLTFNDTIITIILKNINDEVVGIVPGISNALTQRELKNFLTLNGIHYTGSCLVSYSPTLQKFIILSSDDSPISLFEIEDEGTVYLVNPDFLTDDNCIIRE